MIIQGRDVGNLGLTSSNVSGETWSNSGYTLKVQPRGFCDRSNLRCEREWGVKNYSDGLSSWKDGTFIKMTISVGRAGCREESQGFSFGQVKSERPIRHSSRDVNKQTDQFRV